MSGKTAVKAAVPNTKGAGLHLIDFFAWGQETRQGEANSASQPVVAV